MLVCYIRKYVIILGGYSQPKYWGDVSPASPVGLTPVALSVHLSRAKLITRFDDRYAVAKFSKSGVYDTVPEGSALIFGDNQITRSHGSARVL